MNNTYRVMKLSICQLKFISLSSKNIFIDMLNSPKTSTSLSELQNAFDLLMSDNQYKKSQVTNECPQQTTSVQKMKANFHSSIQNSPHQSCLHTQQFSVEMQNQDFPGLSQNIHSATQLESYSIKTPFQNAQCHQEIRNQRSSTESSELVKSRQKKGIDQHTQITQTNSISQKNKKQLQTEYQNHLRKSVDNQTALNAMDSMFRKKNSLNCKNQQGKQNSLIEKQKNQLNEHQNKNKQNLTENDLMRTKIQQRAVLMQRLKNLHVFYRMRIDQEINQRKTNDLVFMDMLQQNQISHKQKIQQLKRAISEQKRQKISLTKRQKMVSRIESTTQFSIKQREKARESNAHLQQNVLRNNQRIEIKANRLVELQEEQMKLREQVQKNQKTQLRLKKWKRQIETFIIKGQEKVEHLKRIFQRQYDNY